ncbi:MAG TPA: hypothetical protein VFG86_06040 [Chloroflexota bacterium]|nr:hypothetical protein [Chloroflexota bacterium]
MDESDHALWRQRTGAEVVGESIRQVFGGQIGAFLAETGSDAIFGSIRRLLADQLDRSSAVET